jgi:hypothetical protein
VIHDESAEHPDAWPVHGFLLVVDGGVVFLNDAGQMAELGRRLGSDLSAAAYAEVLARFHGPARDTWLIASWKALTSFPWSPARPTCRGSSHRRLSAPADRRTLRFSSSDHPRHVGGRRVSVDRCRG